MKKGCQPPLDRWRNSLMAIKLHNRTWNTLLSDPKAHMLSLTPQCLSLEVSEARACCKCHAGTNSHGYTRGQVSGEPPRTGLVQTIATALTLWIQEATEEPGFLKHFWPEATDGPSLGYCYVWAPLLHIRSVHWMGSKLSKVYQSSCQHTLFVR